MRFFLCGSSKNALYKESQNNGRNRNVVPKEQSKSNELGKRIMDLQNKLEIKQSQHQELNEIYSSIKRELIIEEKQLMEDFEAERTDPDTKLVIVLGNTGDGKSTFCNRLTGDVSKYGNKGIFATSHEPEACTKSHFKSTTTINGTKISLVDTPGFYDPAGEDFDRRHGNMLCKYLKGCGGVNAFVLVRNSTNIRYDSSFQEMLKSYQKMFGNEFFNRLIVIATRVDYTNEAYIAMKQDISMKEAICKQFNIKDIPVIPIGVDNYKEALSTLCAVTAVDKLECNDISSPINELYATRSLVEKQMEDKKKEMNLILREYKETIDKYLMETIGKKYDQATEDELKQLDLYMDCEWEWIEPFVQAINDSAAPCREQGGENWPCREVRTEETREEVENREVVRGRERESEVHRYIERESETRHVVSNSMRR